MDRNATGSIPFHPYCNIKRSGIDFSSYISKQTNYSIYPYLYFYFYFDIRLFSICREGFSPTTSTYLEVHYFEEVVAGGIPANGSSSKTLLDPLTSTCFINSNYSRGKDLECDTQPCRERAGRKRR